MTPEELVEALADKEHESWANWMIYLFEKGEYNSDGSFTIPKELVDMWGRKAAAPYSMLTNKEQESDRIEVRNILPLIAEYMESSGIDSELHPFWEGKDE